MSRQNWAFTYRDLIETLSDSEAGQLLKAVARRYAGSPQEEVPRTVQLARSLVFAVIDEEENHRTARSRQATEAIRSRWSKRDGSNEYVRIRPNTEVYERIRTNESVKTVPPPSSPIYNPPEKAPKGALSVPPDGETVREFEQFWEEYRKKVGKREALAAWKRLTKADRSAALAKVAAYVEANPDAQFRPDPVRWIKHRRWEDEIIDRQATPEPRHQKATVERMPL